MGIFSKKKIGIWHHLNKNIKKYRKKNYIKMKKLFLKIYIKLVIQKKFKNTNKNKYLYY